MDAASVTPPIRAHVRALEPIEGRTPGRLALALVLSFVVFMGVWGAVSTVQDVRAQDRAERVERALQDMRYQVGLERAVLARADEATAVRDLDMAATAVAADLRRMRSAGRHVDRLRAASLASDHERVVSAVHRALRALPVAIPADRQAEDLAASVDRSLSAVRGGEASIWPAEPQQKV